MLYKPPACEEIHRTLLQFYSIKRYTLRKNEAEEFPSPRILLPKTAECTKMFLSNLWPSGRAGHILDQGAMAFPLSHESHHPFDIRSGTAQEKYFLTTSRLCELYQSVDDHGGSHSKWWIALVHLTTVGFCFCHSFWSIPVKRLWIDLLIYRSLNCPRRDTEVSHPLSWLLWPCNNHLSLSFIPNWSTSCGNVATYYSLYPVYKTVQKYKLEWFCIKTQSCKL